MHIKGTILGTYSVCLCTVYVCLRDVAAYVRSICSRTIIMAIGDFYAQHSEESDYSICTVSREYSVHIYYI